MLRSTSAVAAMILMVAACTSNSSDTTVPMVPAPLVTAATTTVRTPTASTTTQPSKTATATTTPTTAPITTTMLAAIEDVEAGLLCHDLDSRGYGYADAVAYWTREGQPERMDADNNGIPCETVYDRALVVAFWGEPLPTTTTTAINVRYAAAIHGLHPHPLPGSGSAFGSGCSPGSSVLPDGIWYGYVRDLTATSITFDLACLEWVPDSSDGANEGGAWVIGNSSLKTMVVPVHVDALAICDWMGCPPGPFPYTHWMERAPVFPEPGSELADRGVWLYVNGGVVTEVGEAVLAG